MSIIEQVGLVASVSLPMFNIPLIIKIIRRQSSADLSLSWVIGVWVCCVLMLPAGLMSTDMVWRSFSIINLILFSGVFVVSIKYRKGKNGKD